ncbi:replication factor C subunit 1-like [Physella acuta]|uniref:replication factor C subunit 1-like n=1 Tax=Physella acuta TaxID=109671 RepID=UPI0027DC2E9A|nr:replication factor C subunit 1-like [Physella acuta]
MDIRNFFGSSVAHVKSSHNKQRVESGKQSARQAVKCPTQKASEDLVSATRKGSAKHCTTFGTSSQNKYSFDEESDAIVVNDDSDSEIIKNSQDSFQGKKKMNGLSVIKGSSQISKDKNSKCVGKINEWQNDEKNSKQLERKKSVNKKQNENKRRSLEEELIEVESVKSGSSKSAKLSSQGSESIQEKRGESTNAASNDHQIEIKANPKKRAQKRKLSGEEEISELSSSDADEFISSRRKKASSSMVKSSKKNRVLDSDSDEKPLVKEKSKGKKEKKELQDDSGSDEDPLPKEKPKGRQRKKENHTNDSDEERKLTALDKFVIHKRNVKGSAEAPVRTPVSVVDFFGSGNTSRCQRTTAVSKRKHGDTVEKDDQVDLTFDEECHDDEDFLKTLDQLDGPNVKKVKVEEENPALATETSSLADKLASKIKQREEHCVANLKEETQPAREHLKTGSGKKKVSKKEKIYTMEVTKPADKVKVESPPQDEIKLTPDTKHLKILATTKSPTESADLDESGFGRKGISGFQAFKARSGPAALGSKDIPEGAENCLEGLTFVITGVLDSIERDEAKSLIERHGGKVTASISGRTSFLVVGREPGQSKITKGNQLKVKQVDEDQLFDLIRSLPGKVSKYEIQAKDQIKKESLIKDTHYEGVGKHSKTLKFDEATPSGPAKCLFTQIKSTPQTSSADVSPPLNKADGPSCPESLLWVDKHKPTSLKNIIGQQGEKSNARKLLHWLTAWHENIIVKRLKASASFFAGGKGDGSGNRAALLSGPPGIGKTTTATLVCKEAKFSYVELNASDCRSKRSLKEVVSESLNNQTLIDYMGENCSNTGQRHCLIMDEVDGMAGNEDRGGLNELVQLIKSTKIPIICICNDRNSVKMRSLSNYCLDLRFTRPKVEQIKGAMMSLAFKEGVKVPPAALNEIILASNHDIRQIIHNLSMWSVSDKNLTFDQVKMDSSKAQKDVKLGPFDVCRKVFVSDEETRKMSLTEKADLFFHDYSFGPLFVHENYPSVIPFNAKGNHSRHMSCLARTIDSICDGDMVEKLVRKDGNWSLLPTQAMYSSVIPGELMRGSFPAMTSFPQWLGKFSSTSKTSRILQELNMHMRLVTSCDKQSLNMDYLPTLRSCLTSPLVTKATDGVSEVIKVMDDYDIIKDDFDNILEVTKWPNSLDPMSKLDSKTKAAFTRRYNKEIHLTPYATGTVSKRKIRGTAMVEEEVFEEDGGEERIAESEKEEDEDIEQDTMIKTKNPGKLQHRAAGGSQKSGSQKIGSQKGGSGQKTGKKPGRGVSKQNNSGR